MLLMLDEPSMGLAPFLIGGNLLQTIRRSAMVEPPFCWSSRTNMALAVDRAYALELGKVAKHGTGLRSRR